jgi:hypothetical protein
LKLETEIDERIRDSQFATAERMFAVVDLMLGAFILFYGLRAFIVVPGVFDMMLHWLPSSVWGAGIFAVGMLRIVAIKYRWRVIRHLCTTWAFFFYGFATYCLIVNQWPGVSTPVFAAITVKNLYVMLNKAVVRR